MKEIRGKSQKKVPDEGKNKKELQIDDLSFFENVDPSPKVQELLKNIKARLPELKEKLADFSSHWGFEDRIYRYYHYSFKIVGLQQSTMEIIEVLKSLLPGQELNKMFMEIISEGTGKRFDASWNHTWSQHGRPILEAFFHARFFLEMAVKYGDSLDVAPRLLPSGWAAILCLYDIREEMLAKKTGPFGKGTSLEKKL